VKNPRLVFPLLAVIALTIAAAPAFADVAYENGPINGQVDAWTINFGFVVSDSFTISTGNTAITGLSFGAWLFPGDVLQSVEVSLTSEEFGGTVYFDGVVNFVQSGCFLNSYSYNVCTETGSFNGPSLDNGTYWLNLENAVVNNGDPVYWDENSGIGCHSPGCPSEAGPGGEGTLPSEAFTLLSGGTTSTTSTTSVPEPSSVMLVASGALGVGGILLRKLRQVR